MVTDKETGDRCREACECFGDSGGTGSSDEQILVVNDNAGIALVTVAQLVLIVCATKCLKLKLES